MSDPAAAVDGSAHTAWTPGPGGRMVVDLGAAVPLGTVTVRWTGGRAPAARVETSTDGLTYQQAGTLAGRDTSSLRLQGTARYVALRVQGGAPHGARLVSLAVTGGR